MNPDYDNVIQRLHLYYDMKLVAFGIDKDRNQMIQFQVFIQPNMQQPLILYQIETVPVPIVDQNKQASSYSHVQIDRPYIALNSESYMLIRQQLENCNFAYYFNKTDITPTVLDRSTEIILANWPDSKHIICNVNNDIPVKIPSHLFVLVNRSVLYNCGLEAENNFLLELLAACHNAESKLVMYFTVNTAFVNYLDNFDNITETLEYPILNNWATHIQTLPISLQSFEFTSDLLNAPKTLKVLVHQFQHRKKFLIARKAY